MSHSSTEAQDPYVLQAQGRALRAISMMRQFLYVPLQIGDAEVVVLLLEREDLPLVRFASRIFGRVRASRLLLVGKTDGVNIDAARTALVASGIPHDAISLPEHSMSTQLELQQFYYWLQRASAMPSAIAAVSVPHKALRLQFMLGSIFSRVRIHSCAPEVDPLSSSTTAAEGDARSWEERLAVLLATELLEFQWRLEQRHFSLPERLLGEPFTSESSPSPHALPERLLALARVYGPLHLQRTDSDRPRATVY